MLGRHRQAPVLGSQPGPSAPPTSHRQPRAEGVRSPPAVAPLRAPPTAPQDPAPFTRAPGALPTPSRVTGREGNSLLPPAAARGSGQRGRVQAQGEGARTGGRRLRGAGRRGGGPAEPVPPPSHATWAWPRSAPPWPWPPRPSWASASADGARGPSRRALTAAAEVVGLVQPKEAVPAGCTRPAAHVGLAEAVAVALGAKGEAGTRWGARCTCLHHPQNLARTLTGWHSATPPSVPLGSQLQPGVGRGGPEWGGAEGLDGSQPSLPLLHPPGVSHGPHTHSGQTHGCSPWGCWGSAPRTRVYSDHSSVRPREPGTCKAPVPVKVTGGAERVPAPHPGTPARLGLVLARLGSGHRGPAMGTNGP